MWMIAEEGATQAVHKQRVLPWYEGLLLLEVLAGLQAKGDNASSIWCNGELQGVLDQERIKYRGGLSSTLYTEERLLNAAVTGAKFIDTQDREFAYRRESLHTDDKSGLLEGSNGGGFFQIRDIIGYLPPWEAFCHPKCGFYQDFYKVRWEFPFSEVDYSKVENGCIGNIGATWEPDECLPSHLDPLRLAAKRAWIKKKRELEKQQSGPRRPAEPEPSLPLGKRPAEPEPSLSSGKQPTKRARLRRDGAPLERDCFRCMIGHDFETDEQMEKSFPGIRKSWPKNPREYPKGYGVADPPGFCVEGCDCMDDQRSQRSWETHKEWLEDSARSAAAESAIEALSAQTHFVRRRGQVSKRFLFEPLQTVLPDQTAAGAAIDLAKAIRKALAGVLNKIPLHVLADPSEVPVRIPASLVPSDKSDYEPLQFRIEGADESELPSWLQINADTGELQVSEPQATLTQPFVMKAEFLHAEGSAGVITCGITPERLEGPTAPWTELTLPIAERFIDASLCPLDYGIRGGLYQHFTEIYDFMEQTARELSLGKWVDIMTLLLRMLRSASCANLALSEAHGPRL
jgi:hypothetical protein